MTRAEYWIEKLGMEQHPEGGWFREVYKAPAEYGTTEYARDLADTGTDQIVSTSLGNGQAAHAPSRDAQSSPAAIARPLAGSIYFLLNRDEISHFHVIDCDEIWYHHEGCGVELFLLGENGKAERRVLGCGDGMEPMVIIPHGVVFGARNVDSTSYTMMSCATIPAFRYQGFRLVPQAELRDAYPAYRELIQTMAFAEV